MRTQICFPGLVAVVGMLPVVISGCSDTPTRETPANVVPVSGTVKLNGEAVQGIRLGFIPQQGTSGAGAWAVTDASGNFTVKHMNGGDGIEPGTYQVSFSLMRMPNGDPVPPGVSPTDAQAVEALPRLANPTPDNKQYEITINNAMTDLNYDLKN